MSQTLEILAAGARAALGGAGDGATGDVVRFELFNAANSICSQKARCVLAHHGTPFVSRNVNLFLGETYLPGYVRLRMRGCDDAGNALIAHHSGSTSGSAGCDGVVVPTLIDWETRRVIVDSKRICLHLDAMATDKLRPEPLAGAIDDELAIVDHLPNYQMLMGRTLATESAATNKDVGNSFSQRKVAWCDRYLAENGDDEVLTRAYRAKRAKELSAAETLFSPEAMRAAYGRAEAALDVLEGRLAARSTAWLLSDDVTMADLFWGIELLRMRNVGVATFWEAGRRPQVARFAAVTEALPAIQTGIIDWPGAMF